MKRYDKFLTLLGIALLILFYVDSHLSSVPHYALFGNLIVVFAVLVIPVKVVLMFFGAIGNFAKGTKKQNKQVAYSGLRKERKQDKSVAYDDWKERERQRKEEERREREEERKREEEERRLEKERDQPLYDYTLNHVVGRVKLDRNDYVSSFTLFSFSMFHSRQRISEADIQYAYGKYYIPQKFFEYD